MGNASTLGQKQICIIKRNGRQIGLYRYQLPSGEYPKVWHRDIIPLLLRDVKEGRAVEYIPKQS